VVVLARKLFGKRYGHKEVQRKVVIKRQTRKK